MWPCPHKGGQSSGVTVGQSCGQDQHLEYLASPHKCNLDNGFSDQCSEKNHEPDQSRIMLLFLTLL